MVVLCPSCTTNSGFDWARIVVLRMRRKNKIRSIKNIFG
jgi:hypothetical protein